MFFDNNIITNNFDQSNHFFINYDLGPIKSYIAVFLVKPNRWKICHPYLTWSHDLIFSTCPDDEPHSLVRNASTKIL